MDVKTPANCTSFNLRKAARALSQAFDEALKPSGLRGTQFSLLVVVANRGPAGVSELAKTMVMDRTTLTRNLKPLLTQGLLEVVDGTDRRQRPIAITDHGRDTLARALPLWQQAQARIVKSLGKRRWTGLLADLDETVRLSQEL
jgi:DNA-binding MarR family transcriptional regulator